MIYCFPIGSIPVNLTIMNKSRTGQFLKSCKMGRKIPRTPLVNIHELLDWSRMVLVDGLSSVREASLADKSGDIVDFCGNTTSNRAGAWSHSAFVQLFPIPQQSHAFSPLTCP